MFASTLHPLLRIASYYITANINKVCMQITYDKKQSLQLHSIQEIDEIPKTFNVQNNLRFL